MCINHALTLLFPTATLPPYSKIQKRFMKNQRSTKELKMDETNSLCNKNQIDLEDPIQNTTWLTPYIDLHFIEGTK